MKEIIENRIRELKQAIEQSSANHNGLTGRLLEAEWVLEQQIKLDEQVKLAQPEEDESCD